MANFEQLDSVLRAALPNFGGLNVQDAGDKAKWLAVWKVAPSAGDLATFAARVAATDADAPDPGVVMVQQLRAAALSVNGTAVGDLTAAQVRALVVLLAAHNGWVDSAGKIRVR